MPAATGSAEFLKTVLLYHLDMPLAFSPPPPPPSNKLMTLNWYIRTIIVACSVGYTSIECKVNKYFSFLRDTATGLTKIIKRST
jgi:hypothetical protein